jgi:hypothetical protein
MTKVVVVQQVNGTHKQEINLDGFEDHLRKMFGNVILCCVCNKPVRKGFYYMGFFSSGHKTCVEKEEKKIIKQAAQNTKKGSMDDFDDEDDLFEDDNDFESEEDFRDIDDENVINESEEDKAMQEEYDQWGKKFAEGKEQALDEIKNGEE